MVSEQLGIVEARARVALADWEGTEPDDRLAGLRYELARCLLRQGRVTEAAELFASLLVHHPGWRAETVSAAAALAFVLTGRLDRVDPAVADEVGIAAAARGDLRRAVALSRQAVSRASGAGEAPAYLGLATVQLWADQVDDCRASLSRAERADWTRPVCESLRAELAFRSGDWVTSRQHIEAGLQASLRSGAGLADVALWSQLARLQVFQRDLAGADEALAHAERCLADGVFGLEWVQQVRARRDEARGDGDGIRAAALGHDDRDPVPQRLDGAADVVRVARRHGDDKTVARVLEDVAALAGRWPDSVAPAVLARCRGLAATDPEESARAATLLRRRLRPVEAAFAEWEAASLLVERAGPHDPRAHRLYAAAAAVLGPIGAQPMPVVAPPPVEPKRDRSPIRLGWDALTETERLVVDLVAAGLSNLEIAAKLGCARRTVDSHLNHIYTKLGVTSRVTLGVEASRRAP